eukprot:scaffold136433_cov69-Phaeocystis_antarctica.AAC.5
MPPCAPEDGSTPASEQHLQRVASPTRVPTSVGCCEFPAPSAESAGAREAEERSAPPSCP